MKYPEESIARSLHAVLVNELDPLLTRVAIHGEGVHWHCEAINGVNQCKIHCFQYGREPRTEYYTVYSREGKEFARSRVSSQEQAIDAARDWLHGDSLEAIYHKYSFVNQRKRELLAIRDQVYSLSSKLKHETVAVLATSFGDSQTLHVQSKDRASEISFYGQNQYPDARFLWDSCELFRFQVKDIQALTDVLASWLTDEIAPSELRLLFPWLDVGKLADFYEAGEPILGEFIQSWDWMEEFYYESLGGWGPSKKVLSLLEEMRQFGYDKKLRAGQSLSSLGLSRSWRHGLTSEQPCLWFDFHSSDKMNVTFHPGDHDLEGEPIQLTANVRALLDKLVSRPIT